MTIDHSELLHAFRPEACLVAGALLVLGLDLAAGRGRTAERRARNAALLGLLALAAALAATFAAAPSGPLAAGTMLLDPLARVTRAGVLGLALLALAATPGTLRLPHAAEYVALLLFATAGFTLMAGTTSLLLGFVALELASIALYLLAGFDKSRPESAEAALKYFLFGAVAAAFLLFGFSLLYGLTGALDLPGIARGLAAQPVSPLLLVAVVMVLVGFGFKAAAAPFHLWAPDVYQGAPAPAAALIASAAKLAGLAFFLRLLGSGLTAPAADGPPAPWTGAVAVLALLSLLVGNLAALGQGNVRRLLAYSAVAHAGALLLGVLVSGRAGPGPVVYYAVTYGLATVGAFLVLAVLDGQGGAQAHADLAGLHRRSPLLAGALAACLLSLAGIPPLAGFLGKFLVFAEALKAGGPTSLPGAIALLAIALSAVALYYYLIVLKEALVRAPAPGAPVIRVPAGAALSLIATVALLLALGLVPDLLLRRF
ncbi:MAG: NADH-quinone oxidoreductase subunit N [Verrucomicrobiota bacterium]